MKARIKCTAIISKALTPFPVITATIHKAGGVTYVWLDEEVRVAFWQLCRFTADAMPPVPSGEAFPSLVRNHAIDVETGEVTDIATRAGHWHSGEPLWVRVDPWARFAVDALASYRTKFPQRAGQIAAPDWRSLALVRALAISGGLPDPGVNDPERIGKAV